MSKMKIRSSRIKTYLYFQRFSLLISLDKIFLNENFFSSSSYFIKLFIFRNHNWIV
uniref:Uncharacterized protein n=1 Tax=uncultured gamma proteobacterium EB080_L93H08 TaxID=710973 RepID=E0Y2M3_9GAMM|nr:hypothetical protein [uncultured gamma proteobacterium EB080_L93H08]